MADLRIGTRLDDASRDRTTDPTVIGTAELTTHAVIVGMTGSGKTGLGVVLIEEALSAGIPALVIDPKGDLTNLCLVFPDLAPEDFEPWVNDSDVTSSGAGRLEFATQQAQSWRDGLEASEVPRERLRRLRADVSFSVYTPGSEAGRPLNIVGSLAAPPPGTAAEDMADEIESYVTSLLDLVGIAADPLASREHVLLSTLIHQAWVQGTDLDLATLLGQVTQPPMRKLGVLELDAFFPAADRAAFAVRLNSLLASPTFATWMSGDPIDIESMLRGPDGRPRCSIVTTSHLSDEQRQSVTALVLAKLVTWMRRQSGTSDLRAILYMDEVAGYLPPTANPPTKKPMMTLLKQARAFGLGVVLSTQNPVDVDYKALSNAGTWLVGRLQTERDKARLVDGLKSAAGTVDLASVSDAISTLGKRQFVLKRAASDQPVLTATRWAMSYLRGPLIRAEITRLADLGLVDPRDAGPAPSGAAAGVAPESPESPEPPEPRGAGTPTAIADDETPVAPAFAAGIPVAYLDPAAAWASAAGLGAGPTLQAAAIARVRLRHDDTKAGLVHDEEYEAVLVPVEAVPRPTGFVSVDYDDRDLLDAAPEGAVYRLPAPEVTRKAWWGDLKRALTDHLLATRTVDIQANAALKVYSRVEEAPEEFAQRCGIVAGERADAAIAGLRRKYETRLRTLQTRAGSAASAAQRSAAQHEAEHGAAAQVTTLLGGIFGGRSSRSAAVTQAKRAATSQARVEAAQDKAWAASRAIADLEAELAAEVAAIDADWSAKAADISILTIPLEKSDIRVEDLRLVWVPA
ncbi:MAG: ATP-binding protein [bacterium]